MTTAEAVVRRWLVGTGPRPGSSYIANALITWVIDWQSHIETEAAAVAEAKLEEIRDLVEKIAQE